MGGCVRDRLLGYSVKDIDIATSARPDEVLRLFPDAWEVGAAFGVMLVRQVFAEVATFAERKLQGWPEARPSVSRMRKKMPGGVILP
ncbi:MAG: hypothetical protein ACLSUW_03685 [Akkermansia sp.]